MHYAHFRVRLGSEKAKEIRRSFAFPDLPNGSLARPYAGKKMRWAHVTVNEVQTRCEN
jgi:hypothetical protein